MDWIVRPKTACLCSVHCLRLKYAKLFQRQRQKKIQQSMPSRLCYFLSEDSQTNTQWLYLVSQVVCFIAWLRYLDRIKFAQFWHSSTAVFHTVSFLENSLCSKRNYQKYLNFGLNKIKHIIKLSYSHKQDFLSFFPLEKITYLSSIDWFLRNFNSLNRLSFSPARLISKYLSTMEIEVILRPIIKDTLKLLPWSLLS